MDEIQKLKNEIAYKEAFLKEEQKKCIETLKNGWDTWFDTEYSSNYFYDTENSLKKNTINSHEPQTVQYTPIEKKHKNFFSKLKKNLKNLFF